MKSKHVANLFIVASVVTMAVWWWPSASPKPKPTRLELTEQPPPPPPPPPADEILPPQYVETDEIPVPPAPTPATIVADPQAELSTTIPNIIRLAQAGDMFALTQSQMPPDEWASMSMEAKVKMLTDAQDPQMQQRLQTAFQILIERMQFIQDAIPTYDETGNAARYVATVPGRAPWPIYFVKVDGRWYLKP